MTTDKLADFWSNVLCVRDRKKCLNRKDMDTVEIDAAGELFIMAVRKVVDSGHVLLMAWDYSEEEKDFKECMNDHSETEKEPKIKGWRKLKNKKLGEDYEYNS